MTGKLTLLSAAVGAALVLATLLTFATLAIVGTESESAAGAKASQPACGRQVVSDWSDGRIDRDYPVRCYRAALRTLPQDLQVYSSAPDDIQQALSARIVQSAQKISGHQGATSVRKIESAKPSAP